MKKFFNKRKAALLLAATMGVSIVAGMLATTTGTSKFSDVPNSHWAYEFVQRAADEGWVSGVGNDRYNPDGTLSSGEFFTMLARAYYPDEVEKAIAENPGKEWWRAPGTVADEHGLLEGTDVGLFLHAIGYGVWMPEYVAAPVRREEMAAEIANLLKDKGITVDAAKKAEAQAGIKDWSSIEAKYQDAVSTVYAMGIITGTSEGTFAPERGMTRAEGAVVMCRLTDVLAGKEPTEPETPTDPEPSDKPELPAGYQPGDANQDGVLTEEEVYDALMAFKEEVPEDTPWGDDVFYLSSLGVRCYGCAAFAYKASDQAFSGPERVVRDVQDLRVGDVIHLVDQNHWVIVTGFDGDRINTADGNNADRVNWGSYGEFDALQTMIDNHEAVAYTRYP